MNDCSINLWQKVIKGDCFDWYLRLRLSAIWLVFLSRATYHITGKFGGELNFAVWRSAFTTTKLKSANISYLHIYVWRSLTELPNLNLNLPIFLQWWFWAQPPTRQHFRLYSIIFCRHLKFLGKSVTVQLWSSEPHSAKFRNLCVWIKLKVRITEICNSTLILMTTLNFDLCYSLSSNSMILVHFVQYMGFNLGLKPPSQYLSTVMVLW